MTSTLSCIFLGIMTLLAVGRWLYPTAVELKKKQKNCNLCKKRIYWGQSYLNMNSSRGHWREHLKCQR